jgi:signal transduction histidine kinase/GAF domain-containing protein
LFLFALWYNIVAFDAREADVSLLQDFIELITTQPGALVYHLVTLFAIQVIVGVAIGHWRRRRDESSSRLLAMGVGLFLARTVLMLVAVLDRAGLASADVVLPPLARFLHLSSLVLVVWAFLPILKQIPRLSNGLVLIAVLLAGGAYAAFASLWPSAEVQGIAYNDYWQQRVWELSTVAILGLALVGSLAWREAHWGWLVCLLALWLAGHSLELTIPVADANSPGWVRLSDLAALPLLAGLVYREALGATSPPTKEGERTRLGAMGMLRVVQRIETEPRIEPALELAASSVAYGARADMVAIGLLVPGPVDVVRIVALHPTTGVILAGQEPSLAVSKHPLLATALQSRHLERAVADREVSRVAGLYSRLGFDASGPLLAQPLTIGDEVLGIMLVGNPKSRRVWSRQDEQNVQAMAAALSSAIAGRHKRDRDSGQELKEALDEARRMAERAQQLKIRLERQRQRTERLSRELRLREEEAEDRQEGSAALAVRQEQVRELVQARDELRAQLAQWRDRARKLTDAKAQLEERVTQMGSAIGHSTDGPLAAILVGDKRGRIVWASQAAHRLLGRSRTALMDTSFQALFDESLWQGTVRRLLTESRQRSGVTTVRLDLEERMLRAELAPLPENDWSGRLAAVFYVAEGSTVQSEMVASLIQQLRTPLTSITGYTNLLLGERTGILGESQRQFLLRVEANVERMEAALNDLIKGSDIEAGQIELAPEPVDVVDVVESVLDSLSGLFEERKIAVEGELSDDLPPVRADRDSFHQVVLNLVSNAVLASEPGSNVRVRARVEERSDELRGLPAYLLVSVTDTGGGIAPEEQRRVFQRFYRAENPVIDGLGETGVGLSVARALVEANGGRIWVESEMGVGSTISFILPLRSAGRTEGLETAGEADGPER